MTHPRFKAAVLALCLLGPLGAQACDRAALRAADTWRGEDKKLHAGFSFVAGVIAKDALYRRSDWAAFGAAMVPGTLKESMDAAAECNRWSWKDMGANAIGALLGVKFRGLIVTPVGVSYETKF